MKTRGSKEGGRDRKGELRVERGVERREEEVEKRKKRGGGEGRTRREERGI